MWFTLMGRYCPNAWTMRMRIGPIVLAFLFVAIFIDLNLHRVKNEYFYLPKLLKI